MDIQHSRTLLRLATLAGVAMLAGCNGNTTPYYFQNSGPCSYLNAKLALVSPAPAATNVPDALPQVVLASSTAFPNSYQAVLTGSVGGAVQLVPFNQFIPAALPAGATAPFPGAIYYASTNPGVTFDSKTSVSVGLNDLNSNCTPGPSIASFTTV